MCPKILVQEPEIMSKILKRYFREYGARTRSLASLASCVIPKKALWLISHCKLNEWVASPNEYSRDMGEADK